MRQFIDLIETFQQDVLYHGTSVYAAAAILVSNVLEAGDHDDGPHGVSLTREPKVARTFGRAVDYRDADNAFTNAGQGFYTKTETQGVVMAFDGTLLKRDHRIVNHAWDGDESESEERVVGKGFEVSKYLLSFTVSDDDLEEWHNFLTAEAEVYAQANDEREAKLALGRRDMLSILKNHPKRAR